MNIEVKSCRISDFAHPQLITNVFLYPKYLLLIKDLFGIDVKYLVVTNRDNNNLLALTVSYEKKILGIPTIINPSVAYYQPIELFLIQRKYKNENQLQELEIYQRISEYYQKYYFKVEKNLSPETQDIRGFIWSGMTASPLYTYVFDLNSYSSDTFFKRQRASLRKAQNLSYQFSQEEDIKSYLRLVKDTKDRQDWKVKIDENVFPNFLKKLIDLEYVKQFSLIKENGEVASTMFCLLDNNNKIAYAWLQSTAIEDLANGASTLLIHTISQHLKDKYQTFDLCGANTNTIARFKASMGAQLKVFYRIKL